MSITPSAGDAHYDPSTGTYRAPSPEELEEFEALRDRAAPSVVEAPRRRIGLSAVVAAVILLALLVALWLGVVLR